jgi:hypothetical protein
MSGGPTPDPREDTIMNANSKIRLTQIAGLLMLFGWWITSAQSASAMPLPPGDPATGTGLTSTPIPAATVVVHDHPSLWAYLLVAAIAIVATLAVVWVARTIRRTSTGRPTDRLRPATV